MRMVDDQYIPTREDLEEKLRDLGFVPQPVDRKRYPHGTDHDLWVFPDGTKSVLFTDKGNDSGEALYCDSDQHEPGKYINYRQIHLAATGVLALDAPEFAKIPLLGPPVWASGPTPPEPKLLPAKGPDAVVEAEFEPVAEPVPSRRVEAVQAQPVERPVDDALSPVRRWITVAVFAFAVALVAGSITLFILSQTMR